MAALAPSDIAGLVLAGGRARRMGGVDKGLQLWRGQALVDHAIARLAPQVREVMLNANRNPTLYASRGRRVVADADGSYAGPLAGISSGLRATSAPWLAVVPCDAPCLPLDLVARLAQGMQPGDRAAVVAQPGVEREARLEPVCCLLSRGLADDLDAYLAEGGRKVETWVAAHARPVLFDRASDETAFLNFNFLADLA